MAANPVLDFLRRIRASGQTYKAPDAELLARFVASRDEAAFTALVQRHGPMVWRLCVRILGNSPDAEDAFQAAFLVLARRASSVSRPKMLGNWLYGVAYRTALKVRADTARRQALVAEKRAVNGPNPADEVALSELRQVLDQELSRLPDRYRVPVVLHYLEGRTQEEVALLLGCSRNTIHSRLARACKRLRGRLTRRGLALSSGGLAAVLSEEASAGVPATLLDATVKAAMLFVAGGSALVPASVVAFAEGVIQAMFLTKMKIALGCVLLLGAVGTGAGALGHQSGLLAPGAQAQAPSPPKDNPGQSPSEKPREKPSGANAIKDRPELAGEGAIDLRTLPGMSEARVKTLIGELRPGDRMSQLVKEQYETARAEADRSWQMYLSAKSSALHSFAVTAILNDFSIASGHLLQAELDLGRNREDYLAALDGQVKRTHEAELVTKAKYDEGQLHIGDLTLTRFARIRAEIWLERFKASGKLPADAPALPR